MQMVRVTDIQWTKYKAEAINPQRTEMRPLIKLLTSSFMLFVNKTPTHIHPSPPPPIDVSLQSTNLGRLKKITKIHLFIIIKEYISNNKMLFFAVTLCM